MAGAAVALAFATVALDEAITVDGWLAGAELGLHRGRGGGEPGPGHHRRLDDHYRRRRLLDDPGRPSLASSQLGPRLLRNFMRDTANQVVLGTFVATFVYCLLVLRTIRRAEEVAFVPHLSVTIGVLFALVSLGVLIYFIHHVSVSIQADEVVARVSAELIQGINRLSRNRWGARDPRPAATRGPAPVTRGSSTARPVPSGRRRRLPPVVDPTP